jgi:hypothetical protein
MGEIRDYFLELSRYIEWHRRRSLLPYDWDQYEEPYYQQIRKMFNIRDSEFFGLKQIKK